eukprot:GHUV01050528.1.p1 GENE.GHUV01050528.1~~GHUV01050528.1.p1  ORF type:complete len:123 (-),score=31.01 GHUV01050528.1:461-829(-)
MRTLNMTSRKAQACAFSKQSQTPAVASHIVKEGRKAAQRRRVPFAAPAQLTIAAQQRVRASTVIAAATAAAEKGITNVFKPRGSLQCWKSAGTLDWKFHWPQLCAYLQAWLGAAAGTTYSSW